jgi:hypothetical protein
VEFLPNRAPAEQVFVEVDDFGGSNEEPYGTSTKEPFTRIGTESAGCRSTGSIQFTRFVVQVGRAEFSGHTCRADSDRAPRHRNLDRHSTSAEDMDGRDCPESPLLLDDLGGLRRGTPPFGLI